jgi:hypothetical protein
MKKPNKTNGSQTLDRVLFLGRPTSDGGAGNGGVTNANQDELSPMPEEFAGLYQAGYEAGLASGRESGYRQGYQAGFGNGRKQGGDGRIAPAATGENAPEKPVGETRAGVPKVRLFGLPCAKCKRFFYSDEERCPYYATPRAGAAEPSSAPCRP